jgi:hypothetical protein
MGHSASTYTVINLLGENINTTKKDTEALLVTAKVMIVEMNAEKTKHMFMLYET